jgi:hypothetical protein
VLLNPAVLVESGLSDVLGAIGQILLSYLVQMHGCLRSLEQGQVHVGPITWRFCHRSSYRCRISSAWEATYSQADEASARANAASVRAAATSDFSSSQSNRRSATSALRWARRSLASASTARWDRSDSQTSLSRQMNNDLAVLAFVSS